jgi:hypothetical protein
LATHPPAKSQEEPQDELSEAHPSAESQEEPQDESSDDDISLMVHLEKLTVVDESEYFEVSETTKKTSCQDDRLSQLEVLVNTLVGRISALETEKEIMAKQYAQEKTQFKTTTKRMEANIKTLEDKLATTATQSSFLEWKEGLQKVEKAIELGLCPCADNTCNGTSEYVTNEIERLDSAIQSVAKECGKTSELVETLELSVESHAEDLVRLDTAVKSKPSWSEVATGPSTNLPLAPSLSARVVPAEQEVFTVAIRGKVLESSRDRLGMITTIKTALKKHFPTVNQSVVTIVPKSNGVVVLTCTKADVKEELETCTDWLETLDGAYKIIKPIINTTIVLSRVPRQMDLKTIKETLNAETCLWMTKFDEDDADHLFGRVKVSLADSEHKQTILEARKIAIDHYQCFAEDYRRRPKMNSCRKCWNHGHNESDCKNVASCGRCSGNHRTADCQVQLDDFQKFQCIRCIRHDKHQESHGHGAAFPACPSIRKTQC